MNFSFSIDKAIKVLKRFFILILILAIGFYAVGSYLTKRSTSVSYYSYTELYIHTTSSSVEEHTKYMQSESKYIETYLLTINTYKFYEELRQQLPEQWRDKVSAGYMKACVSSTIKSETAIVRFTVYTYDAGLTFAITDTLSRYLGKYLNDNYRVNSVELVEDPRPATASISQSRSLSLIFAVLGALIAFAFGYIKEAKDTRIKNVSDLEAYGVPILGVVPAFNSKSNKKSGKYAYGGYESYSNAASSMEQKNSSTEGKKSKKGKK